MNWKRRKHGGFSLVEVLVGVMILGLVVSPLLHTMVTAMHIAGKGRTAHNMTLTAQNVVETIDTKGIDSLLSDLSLNDSNSLGGLAADARFYSLDSASGVYTFLTPDQVAGLDTRADKYYLGITGLRFAGDTTPYDAMVTLDASEHIQNEYPIANYTAMDGVFCQPADEDENPDIAAAAYFADQAMLIREAALALDPASTLPEMDTEDFYSAMRRSIAITIQQVPDGVGTETGTVSATARFTYTASYAGTDLDPDQYETVFYTSPYDLAADDHGVNSLYFFYFPCYSGASEEPIDIYVNPNTYLNSLSNIPFRFFLVKQRTPLYFAFPRGYTPTQAEKDAAQTAWDTQMQNYEVSYRCLLKLREIASGAERKPAATVFSNVNTNIYTGGNSGPSTFRLLKGLWSIPMSVPNALVDTSERNRLYTVRVELFEDGSDFAPGKRLMVFNASAIE